MPNAALSVDELSRMDNARLSAQRVLQRRPQGNEKPEAGSGDEETDNYLPVGALRTQYMDWLLTKVDEIEEQKESRRYYHGAQLNAEQLRILRGRHQPPMVWNRVGRKINGIVGLVERYRSDPKAEPLTPNGEAGAEIASRAIRYVFEESEFRTLDFWSILQCAIDGVAGVQMVPSHSDSGDIEIGLEWVVGDEYFYTPTNYRMNFEGQRFEGTTKWYDVDEAIDMFPGKEELLKGLLSSDSEMSSGADRDYKWVMTSTKRLRLVEHWYKHKGLWRWAYYCNTTLIEQGDSPFYDHRGESISSFIMFSCAIDHDGDRYGFVRNLKGPQDSLNQGKMKQLHVANTRTVKVQKNAVDDIEILRREVARPDGVIEVNPNHDVEILDNKGDLAVFMQMTDDAKSELDQFGNTNIAALAGNAFPELSGRAIELLRQPGMAELGPFILSYRSWKLKLARVVWANIQRYWKAPRWIKISDDNAQEIGQFIQLNGLGLDQHGRPAIVNAVGEINVKISIDEGPDVATLMQDTYDALKGFAPGTVPPAVLIEMNPNIPQSDKRRFIKMLQPPPPQPNPAAEMAERLQLEALAARNAKTTAEALKTRAGIEETEAAAAQKRASAVTEAARAAHLASQSHLNAAEFARESFKDAAEFERESVAQKSP